MLAPVWIVEGGDRFASNWRVSLDAVAEVHDTVAEPVLLQQVQLDTGVAEERGLSVTDEHRINEELALIDQTGIERVRVRVDPPTVKSVAADVFISWTESGSKLRSSRVLVVETTGSVVE